MSCALDTVPVSRGSTVETVSSDDVDEGLLSSCDGRTIAVGARTFVERARSW